MRQHDDEYAWEADARCRKLGLDPDLFFPERAADIAEPVAHCRLCPVSRQCYDAAAQRRERYGVFGGVNFGSKTLARLAQASAMAATWAGDNATGVTPAKRGRPRSAQCGTEGGYKRHRIDGTPACADCRAANANAKRRRTTKATAVVIDIDTRRRHAAADAMDLTGS